MVPKLPPVGVVPEPIDNLPLFAIVPLFVIPLAIVIGLSVAALFVNVLPLSTVKVFWLIAAEFVVRSLIVNAPVPVIILALAPPLNSKSLLFSIAAVTADALVVNLAPIPSIVTFV